MKAEQLNRILDDLAEEFVPDDINLWNSIGAQMEIRRSSARGIVEASSLSRHRESRKGGLRWAFVALALFVFSLGLLIGTPQGRALARSTLLFFSRREQNVLPIPTLDPAEMVDVTPVITPSLFPTPSPLPETFAPFYEICGSLPSPRCSLDQIHELVDFPLSGISSVPDGFSFIGATGGPESAVLMFQGLAGTLYLIQGPIEEDDFRLWQIAADAQVEAVSVNNLPGEFIQGGWSGVGISEAGVVPWESSEAFQTLRWDQASMRYTLRFFASKSLEGPAFKVNDLVALAEEVSQTASLDMPQPLLPQYLTIEQAKVRAGFSPVEPEWLPSGFSLLGVSHEPERNAICLHYRNRLETGSPALTIFESLGWLPNVEDLKIEPVYNGQPIDIPVTIGALEIGGSELGVGTLASNGVNVGPLCGGIEMTSNKVLLWRSNRMNFILSTVVDQFQGRGFLTNLEMRRVAESLTGVQTIPVNQIDPERLTSFNSLASLSSFDVRVPRRMLSDFKFDHAVVSQKGDQNNPFISSSNLESALLIYLGAPLGDGSDGRYQYLFISQTKGSENQPLQDTALAGGYEPAVVRVQPALHRLDCWEDPTSPAFSGCAHSLVWFEDEIRIEIELFYDKALPEELFVEIAESMR